MRQVFTSPRLETVEQVAQLLRDQGIDVKITNGRSYKGTRRSHFSYREPDRTGAQPALWIVKSEDQPRGRELLRQAGLLASSRSPTSYLPTSAMQQNADTPPSKFPVASRIRIGLMVLLGILVVMTLTRWL